MSIRTGIVVIATWTLLGAPVLCGLGVLVHLCAEDLGSDCHHELSCEADPCQVLTDGVTVQIGRESDDGPARVPAVALVVQLDGLPVVPACRTCPSSVLLPDPPSAAGNCQPLLC